MRKIGTMMVVLVAFLAQVCLAGQTSFSYSTGPNQWSYIAQGSGMVSPTNGWTFSVSVSPDRSFLSLDMIKNVPGEDYQNWYIDLKNSNNSPLTVGSYLATRVPFQKPGIAGFSWVGNGRGNNTLTALVQILEIQYPENGDVPSSVALDFTQFEETWSDITATNMATEVGLRLTPLQLRHRTKRGAGAECSTATFGGGGNFDRLDVCV